MLRRLEVLSLLAVVLCFSASADEPVRNYSIVLLPIVISEPIPGAFGSQWVTEIVGRNTSSAEVRHVIHCPSGIACLIEAIPPHTTFTPDLDHSPSGALFVMHTWPGDEVLFNLRVRDLSRQLDTWGTEIPTIRTDEALTGAAHMLDLPSSERFRLTLRIYDLSHSPGSSAFSVKVYANAGDTLLNELTAAALPVANAGFGYLMLSDLLPGATSGEERFRIVVEPLEPQTPYWAFVSITNNETQHITISTPKTPFKVTAPAN